MNFKTLMIGLSLAGVLAVAPAVTGAETLNGAGATFPNLIYTQWHGQFAATHSGNTINYQSIGSGAGIAQYKAGTVDFGATDAPLTDAEVSSLPQPTLHIPTVAGAVVMIYNIPGVGPGLHLTGDIIADIYLGKIKTWNDPRIEKLNAGRNLPSQPITVVHRADGSGTSFIYTSYLSAVSGEWKSGPGVGKSVSWPCGIGGAGNPAVAGLVKNSRGAIGYVELAYAIQNKLAYAAVRNKSGNFVTANLQSTAAAANAAVAQMQKDVRVSIVNGPGINTYPISGFTYLLVPKSPRNAAKGRVLVEYLHWIMQEPQQAMAEEKLYAPLPASVLAINEKSISKIKVR